MIDASALLSGLKVQVAVLEFDLRTRSDDPATPWGAALRAEHRVALARERTAFSWNDWRDGEVSQAAVSWALACVFVRFCEDNDLTSAACACCPTKWLTISSLWLE